MDAIIVTDGTAEEIAALAVRIQGRQGADRPKEKEPVKLAPGMLVVLDAR